MSDESLLPASPAPGAPTAPPAAPSRRRGWFLLVLLLLLAALASALWFWQQWRMQGERLAQREGDAAAWQQRLSALESTLDGVQRSLKTLETRATDNSATNKVLREELLGMGERAALLEDAVARLADNRLRGEVVMRLNEAEFLLLLGEERLRLFGDAPAAIQAYGLADAALAGLDDAPLATLRQTLAQELAALRAIPLDARARVRAGLEALARDLDSLPSTRRDEVAVADANDSRLMQLLSRLVTVRRVDPQQAVFGPVQREAALAALRLRLELAQAALARPDPAAFTQALDAAALLMPRLFDASRPEVARRIAELAAWRDTALLPELPVLGATLQELRGLRATRSLAAPVSPAPADSAEEAAASGPEAGQ